MTERFDANQFRTPPAGDSASKSSDAGKGLTALGDVLGPKLDALLKAVEGLESLYG